MTRGRVTSRKRTGNEMETANTRHGVRSCFLLVRGLCDDVFCAWCREKLGRLQKCETGAILGILEVSKVNRFFRTQFPSQPRANILPLLGVIASNCEPFKKIHHVTMSSCQPLRWRSIRKAWATCCSFPDAGLLDTQAL